jgi:hypothetical protein
MATRSGTTELRVAIDAALAQAVERLAATGRPKDEIVEAALRAYVEGRPPGQAVAPTKPLRRKAVVLAGAVLLAGSLGVWVLWPRTPASPPPPALTGEADGIAAAVPGPAAGMPAASEADQELGAPWVLTSQSQTVMRTATGWTAPVSGAPSGLASGHFATQDACQAALHAGADARIAQLRQEASDPARRLSVDVVDRPNYVNIMRVQRLDGRRVQRTQEDLFYYLNTGAWVP